jgi:DNA-directed RNA polymerase specialized sigma24 family protein
MLGLDEALTAREFLGAIRCTLGQRRDLHAGSRSDGKVVQEFPEVWTTQHAYRVALAFHRLRVELRDVLLVHYVAKAPIALKCDALAVSQRTYWARLAQARNAVEPWLT